MIRRVVIAGGGIGGLTAAIALRKVKGIEQIHILEKHPEGPKRAAPASGIALWRNSIQIYEYLGLLPKLNEAGAYLEKNINYFNAAGISLAKAPKSFHTDYPIICLQREDLQNLLVDYLTENTEGAKVIIQNGNSCINSFIEGDIVNIETNSGETIQADFLVGADGLHSQVRESVCPLALPIYCGYTYYRATLNKNQLENISGSIEDWFSHSFESWGEGKRFGYVPLKDPSLFWFASIPSDPLKSTNGTNHVYTTQNIKPEEKEKLFDLFSSFQSPIEIEKLIHATNNSQILRTDIYKVPVVPEWFTEREVLLGDAAHATSPNLAQGAGLAIEDAMQLAHDINTVNNEGNSLEEALKNYKENRFPRAKAVQFIADSIAFIGQTKSLSYIRDSSMSSVTRVLPLVQQSIFKIAVRYSLGWNWKLPTIGKQCLWEKILRQDFHKLPATMKGFRRAEGGSGTGSCTVEYPNILVRLIGKCLMFPDPMQDSTFFASVKNTKTGQLWKRIFGYKTKKETVYETTMKVSSGINPTLIEQKGTFQFVYSVQYDANSNQIHYQTKQFYLFPGIKLWPFLSPYSEWFETPTKDGWEYDGFISLPVVGKVFRYFGRFAINKQMTSVK